MGKLTTTSPLRASILLSLTLSLLSSARTARGFSVAPPLPSSPPKTLRPSSSSSSFLLLSSSSSTEEYAIDDEATTTTKTTPTPTTTNDPIIRGAEAASKFWKWRGHDIFAEVRTGNNNNDDDDDDSDDDKPAVVLLHGFGASATYWRETASVLQSEGYDVHALDLLGQGRSSKPVSVPKIEEEEEEETSTWSSSSSSSSIYRLYSKVAEGGDATAGDDDDGDGEEACPMEMGENTDVTVEYSINLWANLVDDYARHRGLERVVLMGNSLGSLVALSVATGDFAANSFPYLAGKKEHAEGGGGRPSSPSSSSRVAGICLFNCAVGLNSRNVIRTMGVGPIRRAIFDTLFDVLNFLVFDNESLLRFALDNVVTPELLEGALKSLYVHSPERVDRELVDSFYCPAKTGGDGAVEAIRQIYTNDAGRTPMEFHEKYPEILNALPVHLVWGLEDVVTPLEGDVGTFYCDRVANNRGGRGRTTIDVVRAGHVPFDDNPAEANRSMMRWLGKRS